MSMPLCSLSKRKRIKPIEWTSSDRKRWVKVTAPAESGIATIWDLDIVLWAISQLNEAVERDAAVGHSIRFQAYDLLKATGRHTGGKNYAELEMALRRLTGTVIETSIRADKRRGKAMFHWVEAWSHDLDQDGRSKGMTITVPDWIYQAVVVDRSVLAISPKYFEITSGIGRWLYRLARRHAGKQPNGWRFTMKDLHKLNSPEFSRHPRFLFPAAVRTRRATTSRSSRACVSDCRTSRCSRTRPVGLRPWSCRSGAVSVRA